MVKKRKYRADNNFGERRKWSINPTQKIHGRKYKKHNRGTKDQKNWKKED